MSTIDSPLDGKGEKTEKTLDELAEGDVSLDNLNKIWKKRVKQKDCGKKEYHEVEAILKKFIELEEDFAEAYHKLGNVYYRLKFYEEAEKCYKEALKKEWKDKNDKAWCYHDLGYLLYGARKYEKAIENYKEAINIAEKAKDEKSIAWFYIDLGTARMKSERYEVAENAFYKALSLIKKGKDKAYVYNAFGRLYYRRGLYKEARKKLELAKKRNTDLDKVYNNLGLLDFEAGSYEKAKLCFQKAIEMDKSKKKECENLAEAHLNLGNVFFKEENYTEADREYKEAIRIDRNSAEAYYSLGNLAAKNKEKERAVKLYGEALRINPDYTKARKALEALDLPKEAGVDWWDWWFRGSEKWQHGRKPTGMLLIIALLGIIGIIGFITLMPLVGTIMPPGNVTYEHKNDTTFSYQKISIENSFSVDAKFENDLNNQSISKELENIFKTKGFSISESKNATVTEEKDNKWVISDGEKIYIVKKEDGKLIVYKGSIDEIKKEITETFSNATTPRTRAIPSSSIWTLIGLAGFIFIILIFPQLKKGSVSIGGFTFEVETKDAGTSDIAK
jgi:tetratricopeptide (TPR) repeat protein